jgi:phosphinothricin acetyltransferase
VTIRDARPADAARIAAIYNQGIAERGATFETAERTPVDVRDWIGDPGRPLLVAERGDGAVAGFARVAPYSDRPVYRGIGEYSVYLDGDARGAGLGRALLEALLVRAEATGHWKLTSRLFPENAASRALAAACGFREVGVHERHARLDGAWRDVIVVERLLGDARRQAP